MIDFDLKDSQENYYGRIDSFDLEGDNAGITYYRNKQSFDRAVTENTKNAFIRFKQYLYPTSETMELSSQEDIRIEILTCSNSQYPFRYCSQILSEADADKLFAAYDIELSKIHHTLGPDGRYIGGCKIEFMLHLPDGRSYKIAGIFGMSNYENSTKDVIQRYKERG